MPLLRSRGKARRNRRHRRKFAHAGTVLKLAVADGATVKKGEKILVLEAMKMENDINASADGVVTFMVKAGESVETGTKLAVIK
ncbi:MAG: biotin/lipoyl-containing protein [Christensenellales bacterium]